MTKRCLLCNGTGQRVKSNGVDIWDKGTMVTCPVCDGTGTVEETATEHLFIKKYHGVYSTQQLG